MSKEKRYTEQFKQEAVKQVIERGYSVAEVADRLGIPLCQGVINDAQVAAKLNNRPRKTLGFYSPSDKLNELLQ
jgi:transposase-like protein